MFQTGIVTGHKALFDELISFIAPIGSAFGLIYDGLGTGTLVNYSGGSASVAESFAVVATTETTFSVTGSVSGLVGTATVGTPFNSTKVNFTIEAGGVPFVETDAFTLSTTPPWTLHRGTGGATVSATQGTTGMLAAQNLVDGKQAQDDNRIWRVDSPVFPLIVEFTLPAAAWVAAYELMISGLGYGPKTWQFDAWNGSGWDIIESNVNVSWSPNQVRRFTLPAAQFSTRYRIQILEGEFSSLVTLAAVRLFGDIAHANDYDVAFGQAVFEAPGNDGDSEIFLGIHPFERADIDYFDWELSSFDGFNPSAPFIQQAGVHRQLYLPLWDDPIAYWFIADGRRLVVIAKLGSQYEVAYLGLLDGYFTPLQAPYPMALGGSLAVGTNPLWNDTVFRHSNGTLQHSAFSHSDRGVVSGIYNLQLRSRNLDGSWSGYEAKQNDAIASAPLSSENQIWPFRSGLTLLDQNIDGGSTLWPLMLNHSAPNTVGQLSGVFAVSGQGLAAETLIRIGAIDYIVIPNIFRTDRDDFLAIALD